MIPFCLLAGLKVGGPRRPCGGEEGSIETISFRGAERRAIGLPKHRYELGPPRLGSICHPLQWSVQRELGHNSVQVGAEPGV